MTLRDLQPEIAGILLDSFSNWRLIEPSAKDKEISIQCPNKFKDEIVNRNAHTPTLEYC